MRNYSFAYRFGWIVCGWLLLFLILATLPMLAQSGISVVPSSASPSVPSPFINIQGVGSVSGNIQSDVQWYLPDSSIGAPDVPEQILSNTSFQVWWNYGRFSAGLRYEAFVNPLLGFDARWRGQGIAYRSLSYNGDLFDVTVGNFYEQFGTGLILRSFEDRQLGIDNALDGIRLRLFPLKGISLTTIFARQRFFWSLSDGLVRGADMQLALSEVFPALSEHGIQWDIGLSGISRYQPSADPVLKLPDNAASLEGRMNLAFGDFSLTFAGAVRAPDPTAHNNYTYNSGNAAYINCSFAQKGFSLNVSVKRIDNMDIRSDRNVLGSALQLSFLPPLTAQHSYRLSAFYPYATQANGEFAVQGDVGIQFPRGSVLGGAYGTSLSINYSRVHALDTVRTSEYTYRAGFAGEQMFFQDINIEWTKKWSSQLYTAFQLVHIDYDKDQIEATRGFGLVSSTIVVADITYSLDRRHTLRFEGQHLGTSNDAGSWAFALAEYTLDQTWYFSVFDEFNYGNPNPDRRAHYLSGSITYRNAGFRAGVSFGRQRAGIICVGGLCRVVPASSGLAFSFNATL